MFLRLAYLKMASIRWLSFVFLCCGGGLVLGWNFMAGFGWALFFLLAGFYFIVVDI